MNKPASLALTALLLGIAPGTAPLHAAPAAAPGEAYYTEERIYQSRPGPTQERFFGVIGTTGRKVRVYPGVVLKVEEMMPASPCEGKFAKQEILTGIKGTALKGLDPFVAMGNALTKAEATDGRMVFDVTSADGKTQPKETVTIPVLGAYSKTWPLDRKKSKRIIAEAAAFYSDPEKFNQGGIPAPYHDQIEAEIAKGCTLIYLETPTNPTTKIIDIARLSKAAHVRVRWLWWIFDRD